MLVFSPFALPLVLITAVAAGEPAATQSQPASAPAGEVPTYRVTWLSEADIRIDGRLDEADWKHAAREERFTLPWSQHVPPRTRFEAICDEEQLCFAFSVKDPDLFVLDTLRDKQDIGFEDRVEIFLSRDDGMRDYICLEMDPRGRVMDYRAAYYRKTDMKWRCPGLKIAGRQGDGGYVVEGRLALDQLEKLGFPRLRPGVRVRAALCRAEFSHDRTGRAPDPQDSIHHQGRRFEGTPPLEDWMTWVDPHTKEPDFHVPAAMGWLVVATAGTQ